ncbi:UBN2 domain-containing protein [Cephalotus follicularis]|uniref:UBN2 domain-containing protein n=1 Tax=Cephalotus follicularis TaxID=3775 RepID=A0A1Q3DE79_CEPFO|nr:UBN2 domain-containing protein [Cephalotus follicularis]
MRTYLRAYDLWETIEKGYQPPVEMDNPTVAQIKQQKEESSKNFKALSFLDSAVAESIFPRIMASTTAKEAWDTLQDEFQGSDRVRAIRLLNFRRDYENLKMKDNETVKDYVLRIMKLVNQMRIYGEKISDQKLMEKVLISLPDRFDPKVSTIEESKDLSTVTLNELIGSLQIHESWLSKRIEVAIEGAFQAKQKNEQSGFKEYKKPNCDKSNKGKNPAKDNPGNQKGKFPPCRTCKKTSHLEQNCWFKIKCKICNKFGHLEKFRRFKNTEPSQKNQTHQPQAHVAENKQQENHLFMAA